MADLVSITALFAGASVHRVNEFGEVVAAGHFVVGDDDVVRFVEGPPTPFRRRVDPPETTEKMAAALGDFKLKGGK